MKEITLTQNKVALVDDEDFEFLSQFKWCAYKNRGTYEARRVFNCKALLMHRVIMNTPDGLVTDHRNGNKLDNRKENLRNCTQRQNSQNKKNCHNNNSLGVKGVYIHGNKFEAHLTIKGKQKYLGYFNVLGDADSAYRIAEKYYFKEFARLSSQ